MRTFAIILLTVAAAVAQAAGPPVARASVKQETPKAEAAPVSPQPNHTKPASKPATGPAVPDADLQRAIQARFAKSKISADGFMVKVQGGTAILEGRTGVIQHKGTATRLAKRAGAKRVDNRIQISEEARQKAAARLGSARSVAQLKVSRTN